MAFGLKRMWDSTSDADSGSVHFHIWAGGGTVLVVSTSCCGRLQQIKTILTGGLST